jgi:large subunit ribosomal protein L15
LLKLRQHLKPENYPLPLREPISPLWRVSKLQRIEKSRGLSIEYTKPKWLVEAEAKQASVKKSKIESTPWVFPVPIV